MKTCFDHNSLKSSPIRSSFCTHVRSDTISPLILRNKPQMPKKLHFSKRQKKRRPRLLNLGITRITLHIPLINNNKTNNKTEMHPEWKPIKLKIGRPHLQTPTKNCTKARLDPCRFRKVMIKTSFQLFLLIKTIEKIVIFEKSFLGPINEFLDFFFMNRENTQ